MQGYVDQGGVIIPDVLAGQQTVMESDIQKVADLFTEQVVPIPIRSTPNSIIIDVRNFESGFFVINERMHLFPGWKTYVDAKLTLNGESERLEKTNFMLSSIYLKEPAKKIQFIYSPASFETGRTITLITLALVLVYLVWLIWKRKKYQ